MNDPGQGQSTSAAAESVRVNLEAVKEHTAQLELLFSMVDYHLQCAQAAGLSRNASASIGTARGAVTQLRESILKAFVKVAVLTEAALAFGPPPVQQGVDEGGLGV